MKKVFLDINVVLDLLGERTPFLKQAREIVSLADQNKIELYVASLTYATCYYVLSRTFNNILAIDKLKAFKVISKTAKVDDEIIDKAFTSNFEDFEDAIQHFSALEAQCNIIVTRNEKDFKNSLIPVLNPTEYLATL